MSTEPEIVTTEQAADLLQVCVSMLEKYRISGGGPPFYKVGRNVRYKRAEVLAWFDSQQCGSTSDDNHPIRRRA